jgi:hypothetical protein
MFEHLQHQGALRGADFPCPQRDLPHQRFRQRLADELVHRIDRWPLLAEIVERHVKEPGQGGRPLHGHGVDRALP